MYINGYYYVCFIGCACTIIGDGAGYFAKRDIGPTDKFERSGNVRFDECQIAQEAQVKHQYPQQRQRARGLTAKPC